MQLSPYQSQIIEAVRERIASPTKKGLLVEALAGCGKSTIIWMLCQQLQIQGFSPDEVVVLAFGKKNQLDLQQKMETKVGKPWGTIVRTIHSLCYEIYRNALGVAHNRCKVEGTKYREIAKRFGLLPSKDDYGDIPGSLLEGKHPAIYSETDFLDLLDLLRLYCLDAIHDHVEFLISRYKLGIKNVDLVTKAAQQCLTKGLNEATSDSCWLDQTDMVWVPWVLRKDSRFNAAILKKRQQLRLLALDEAQDTDILQIEVLSLLIDPDQSFLVAVGDRHQSVYFFRGCLNDGIDRITERFCGENLPLPVNYRCGKKHLELVREVFPHIPIQPHDKAPKGEIRVVLDRDFLKIFENNKLSYMGTCRKNAPLTKAAIQLLAAGKPAKIKDKNIGGRLVARVRDICFRKRYNPETFGKVLREYELTQKKRLQDFPDSESKINDLEDTLEAIRTLYEHYSPATLKAWENIVNQIFDGSGYSPISLYTIHSGKGGESQVAFILYPEEMPLEHPEQVEEEREQENHLLYVSLTRALADGAEGGGILYLVIREDDGKEQEDNKGKPKWPQWLPRKYRQLWNWENPVTTPQLTTSESAQFLTQSNWSKPIQPDSVEFESNWSNWSEPALSEKTLVGVGLLSNAEPQPDVIDEKTNEIPQPEQTANESNWSESLDDSERQELTALEEKIKQAIAIPKRRWYEGGKALAYIRDRRLYRETHSDFHLYCLQRFGKSRRHIDRWIAAAAALDNLTENGCEILPTSESVLRPIASLLSEQQVEVWNRAVLSVGGCPIAAKVEEVRNEMLGIPQPQLQPCPTQLTDPTETPSEPTELKTLDNIESLEESRTRNYIRTLPLTKMKSLYSWLGELILNLEQEDF